LQRADLYIRNGRLAEAREVLEQAAKYGSGVAALTLGAMYDPTRVAEFGNLGVQADPTLARAWYERAKDLGVVEASSRLSELARK
jgi:TPR repeat protein